MPKTQQLISAEEIKQKVDQFAAILEAVYQGEELVVVMVMKGAFCLTADLIRGMKIPLTIETIRASSYGQGGTQRGELTITGLTDIELTGKNVLVIDDIIDSGTTLAQIVAKIGEKKPKSVKSLVLLSKNVPRAIDYSPDFVLFDIENQFVVGYGLDYKELYRNLPGIYLYSEDS